MTAWSLGKQLGVTTTFVNNRLPETLKMTRMASVPKLPGSVTGNGSSFRFAYDGADTAIAINRLLKDGGHVSFGRPRSEDAGTSRAIINISGVPQSRMQAIAAEFSLSATALDAAAAPTQDIALAHRAMHQPWTGGNMIS